MKKTLLSVLAGITVIGSAAALPSVEERKTLCDKYPDKYVWVEKTEACVPINPCKSEHREIRKGYCAIFGLPADETKCEAAAKIFAEAQYGTSMTSFKKLEDGYFAMTTADGGYIGFKKQLEEYTDPYVPFAFSFGIHGYTESLKSSEEIIWPGFSAYGNDVESLEKCEAVKYLASLYMKEASVPDVLYKDGTCWFRD